MRGDQSRFKANNNPQASGEKRDEMSTLVESIILSHGMKKADFKQLLGYIYEFDEDESGTYWGNKEQFYKRHDRLVDLFEGFEAYIRANDIKLP